MCFLPCISHNRFYSKVKLRYNFPKALLQSILVYQFWNEAQARVSKTGQVLKIEPELIAGERSENGTLAKATLTLLLNTT